MNASIQRLEKHQRSCLERPELVIRKAASAKRSQQEILSCESRESRPYFLRTLKGPAIAAAGPRDCLEVSRLTERTPTKLLFGSVLRLCSVYVTIDKRGVEETLC